MYASRRRFLLAASGTALTTATILTGALPAAAAGPAKDKHGSLPDAALRSSLRRITDAGMVGVFAEVRDRHDVWQGASGVADVETKRPMRPDYQQRVGSITKTFVATALLQLVAERRLVLDLPIGHYLPALAVDGVTVRMLLNHTSGIGDYRHAVFPSIDHYEQHRNTTFDPDALVSMGMDAPRTGAPGERWAYSNTNYILAGLILERVTGCSAAREITRRIIRPLGLRHTYFPGRTTRISGPHAKAYVLWSDGSLRDFSVYNMSFAWMAGALISSTADLNRFYRFLLGGKLLRPTELAQMRTTVPVDPAQPDRGGYGLGLFWLALPSSGVVWGHDGGVLGQTTVSLHSPDGRRQATIAQNLTNYQVPGQPDPIGEAGGQFLATALGGSATDPASTDGPTVGLPTFSHTSQLSALSNAG